MSRDQQKHSRKPQSIGHSLLLKNFFFFNCPLHPSLSKLALLLFTEKIEVITQEISTSQPPDLRNHLPCTQPPQLPFCSNGGSRQGLSKAHPFGFLPSPQEPHPSNRPLPNHRPQALLVPSPSAFVDQTMLVSRKEESYLAPKD